MYSTFLVSTSECMTCNNQVLKTLGTLQGVFGAEMDNIDGRIVVSHTEEVTRNEIESILIKLGFQIRAPYSSHGIKNDKKQIGIMNKVTPQAPEGDVKSGMLDSLHFEIDGLGDGSNLHPLQGIGAVSFRREADKEQDKEIETDEPSIWGCAL